MLSRLLIIMFCLGSIARLFAAENELEHRSSTATPAPIQTMPRDVALYHLLPFLNLEDKSRLAQTAPELRSFTENDPYYQGILREAQHKVAHETSLKATVFSSTNPRVSLSLARSLLYSPRQTPELQRRAFRSLRNMLRRSNDIRDLMNAINLCVVQQFYYPIFPAYQNARTYMLSWVNKARRMNPTPMQRQILQLRENMLQRHEEDAVSDHQIAQAYGQLLGSTSSLLQAEQLEAALLYVRMRLLNFIGDSRLPLSRAFRWTSLAYNNPEVTPQTRLQALCYRARLRLVYDVSADQLETRAALDMLAQVVSDPLTPTDTRALAQLTRIEMRLEDLLTEDQLHLQEAYNRLSAISTDRSLPYFLKHEANYLRGCMLLNNQAHDAGLSYADAINIFDIVVYCHETPLSLRERATTRIAQMENERRAQRERNQRQFEEMQAQREQDLAKLKLWVKQLSADMRALRQPNQGPTANNTQKAKPERTQTKDITSLKRPDTPQETNLQTLVPSPIVQTFIVQPPATKTHSPGPPRHIYKKQMISLWDLGLSHLLHNNTTKYPSPDGYLTSFEENKLAVVEIDLNNAISKLASWEAYQILSSLYSNPTLPSQIRIRAHYWLTYIRTHTPVPLIKQQSELTY